MSITGKQYAVQIIGADEFVVNPNKPIDPVGPHQLLLQVEACGICYSDTKLLHAFDQHPRKLGLTGGLTPEELAEIPSYRPGAEPTVPGHEPVGRVVSVGEKVTHFRVGDRVLVQADWKHLPTAASNAAFGYNFEGALQEFVVIDERCAVTPAGEKLLLRVSDEASAASIGLIEPWATVEGAYSGAQRVGPARGGRMLVVVEQGAGVGGLADLIAEAAPGELVQVGVMASVPASLEHQLVALAGRLFDDIIYFGSRTDLVDRLGGMLANHGILNTVLGGERFDGAVSVDLGRVHYDFVRYCGTTGSEPRDGYAWLPRSAGIRPGDRMAIIGAAGPMGLMHTVRAVSLGVPGISITATDLSEERLAHLENVVEPIAASRGVPVRYLNSAQETLPPGSTYLVCLVPVPAVVAQAIETAGENAVVNAFAGIPAGTLGQIDLQRVIERRIFLTGSSGSSGTDMATVLAAIETGALTTTISLDAICGMAGFPDAIRSVMERTSGGKIVVYPSLHELPLVRLVDLPEALPLVAAKLRDGQWTIEAERALLATR